MSNVLRYDSNRNVASLTMGLPLIMSIVTVRYCFVKEPAVYGGEGAISWKVIRAAFYKLFSNIVCYLLDSTRLTQRSRDLAT